MARDLVLEMIHIVTYALQFQKTTGNSVFFSLFFPIESFHMFIFLQFCTVVFFAIVMSVSKAHLLYENRKKHTLDTFHDNINWGGVTSKENIALECLVIKNIPSLPPPSL